MDQSVLIATTFDRLEELRAKWECIEWPRIDGELDYYTCVMRNRAEIVKPYAVLVESDAEPAAAAAGRIEDITLPARVRIPDDTEAESSFRHCRGGGGGRWVEPGRSRTTAK